MSWPISSYIVPFVVHKANWTVKLIAPTYQSQKKKKNIATSIVKTI